MCSSDLGFSRDDTAEIIRQYVDKGILESDPFKTVDRAGVGKLVETAVTLGKKVRPNIKLGICGEHGGDPKSIEFCNSVGLQYVSCCLIAYLWQDWRLLRRQ